MQPRGGICPVAGEAQGRVCHSTLGIRQCLWLPFQRTGVGRIGKHLTKGTERLAPAQRVAWREGGVGQTAWIDQDPAHVMGLVCLQCIDHQQRHALMVPPAAHQWALRTDLGVQQTILIVVEGPLLAFTTCDPFTAVVVAVLDAATILVRHRQDLAAWMPAQLPAVPFQWPAGCVVGNVLVTVGAWKEGGFLLAVGRFPLQRWLMRPA